MFDNRCSQADTPEILSAQLIFCYFQKIRYELNLRLRNPDITFSRPGAATPALYASKMQTTDIPSNFLLIRHLTT